MDRAAFSRTRELFLGQKIHRSPRPLFYLLKLRNARRPLHVIVLHVHAHVVRQKKCAKQSPSCENEFKDRVKNDLVDHADEWNAQLKNFWRCDSEPQQWFSFLLFLFLGQGPNNMAFAIPKYLCDLIAITTRRRLCVFSHQNFHMCRFLGDLNNTLYDVWWWKSPIGIKRQNVWTQVWKCSICSILVMFGFFIHFQAVFDAQSVKRTNFCFDMFFTVKKPIWPTWWNLGMAV